MMMMMMMMMIGNLLFSFCDVSFSLSLIFSNFLQNAAIHKVMYTVITFHLDGKRKPQSQQPTQRFIQKFD